LRLGRRRWKPWHPFVPPPHPGLENTSLATGGRDGYTVLPPANFRDPSGIGQRRRLFSLERAAQSHIFQI